MSVDYLALLPRWDSIIQVTKMALIGGLKFFEPQYSL